MNKRFIFIGILACIVVLTVGTIVVVDRKVPASDPVGSGAQNAAEDAGNTAKEMLSTPEDDSEIAITVAVKTSEKMSELLNEEENADPEDIQKADETVQPDSQQVIDGKTDETTAGGDVVGSETASAGDEVEVMQLPMASDLPEDWDWEHLPESQGGKRDPATEPSDVESVSESEESSGEEDSTEESETEKPTLSPEEQASIVESATAPVELPPIYFN